MGLSNTEQKRNSGLISAGLAMLVVLATPLAYAQFPSPPSPPPVPELPFCGDGAVNSDDEQCDDGNDVDGDGCSSTCLIEPFCGDGIINSDDEQCDDGNNVDGDRCSSTCLIEPFCGDGIINSDDEQCDDGNNIDGDSCPSTCQDEPTSPPTPPTPPPPTTADLALSLTDTPDPLTVNGQLTYTITVRNNGPGSATDVQVVDPLPPEATVLSASSSQGLCNGTETVVCNLGTLAAGAHNQATVTINVIPTVTGLLSNAAHVTAAEPDPDHANNSSPETTTVEPEDPATADLAITATVEPRASAQRFTYTLRVTNNGLATATGVQLTNDLPRGIALDAVTASQENCSDGDPMLCNLGTLPSGATAIRTIDVIRTEVETLPNRAAVNGEQHDPVPENDFALTSALDLPTPRTTCNSKRCSLSLRCNLSDFLGRTCDNQITLFVDTRARRQSNQRAARGPGRVPFAAAIRNLPGDQTENVRLKLTRKGKKVGSTLMRQGVTRLRGEMQIRNSAGGTDKIRLTVRLR